MSALTIADTICFRPYAVNQLSLRSTALNRFHWLLQVTLYYYYYYYKRKI